MKAWHLISIHGYKCMAESTNRRQRANLAVHFVISFVERNPR